MDLLYSPNLNNFAKAIHNVVFGSPFHSRGIGLEGETHLVFVKVKLHGNLNTSYEEILTNVTPLRPCHVPTTPLGVVSQLKVPVLQNYVSPSH
jgi:hypothetical protein